MKTAELTGAALDWAVEWSQSLEDLLASKGAKGTYGPSTDWAQGGPIIEREGVAIGHAVSPHYWDACLSKDEGDLADRHIQQGPTPLVAAMRCLVASKLGDTVEIPEELCQQQNN
jgi:hypothetical protein